MSLDLATIASTDAARHTPQQSALTVDHGAPPSDGALKLGLKNVRPYQDYLYVAEEPRDIGRTWVFPIRRNLTPFNILKIKRDSDVWIHKIIAPKQQSETRFSR